MRQWRVLINPLKVANTPEETKFSTCLESVRKDVECFFGRVKGRFRILKLAFLCRDKGDIDNVWFTCCILHNILHDFDGLGELEEGVHWAGVDGLHEAWVADPLRDDSVVRRNGGREEVVCPGDKTETENNYSTFRKALLESFTYRSEHNDVAWLERTR